MRNKQPFYHRAVILFTGTREFLPAELAKLLIRQVKHTEIIAETIVVEECDGEPGDPSDLV